MKAQTVFGVAGGVFILAGAAMLWLPPRPSQSAVEPASTLPRGSEPSQHGSSLSREALNAEIARLQAGKEAQERRSGQVQSELDSLRSGLTQVNRNQATIGQEVRRLGGTVPAGDEEAPAALSPEQTREKANAQVRAQLETLEGTMSTQKTDPSALASLQQGFQRAAIDGVQLASAQCGDTLCRMELASDGSVSPEDSLRSLSRVAPWPGQGFARVDSESGSIVVYLAREGHALPQPDR